MLHFPTGILVPQGRLYHLQELIPAISILDFWFRYDVKNLSGSEC